MNSEDVKRKVAEKWAKWISDEWAERWWKLPKEDRYDHYMALWLFAQMSGEKEVETILRGENN